MAARRSLRARTPQQSRPRNNLSTETLTLRPIHPQQVVIRNQAVQTCYTTTVALNTANRPMNANVAGHRGVGIVEEIGVDRMREALQAAADRSVSTSVIVFNG